MLLGEYIIRRRNRFSCWGRFDPCGALSGHLLADDIEDVVHVPDEVELNDGCPDQTLLFPCFRGVFQLKVCSEGGGQVDSRQGAFASRFPDRNAKKGQADETVDCQYQAGDHSNHKNGEERGHAVITVDHTAPLSSVAKWRPMTRSNACRI